MKLIKSAFAVASLVFLMAPVIAATPVVLDFEGIGSQSSIDGFYNGGTDSSGHSGVDYGVQFGTNSLALTEDDPSANFSGEPSPKTVMFFLTGSAILNYEPGFDTGFSFYFSTVRFTGSVKVYDGLNATGNLLGNISLAALGAGPDPANSFSNWSIGSLAFNDTAKSIDFGGTVNQVGYDDITFGSVMPGVPEPSTYALMTLGIAAISVVARRRRSVQ